MGLDGHQAYQFRRVEAGVEVLRVALARVPSPATEHLIADLQKDLLLLGVMTAPPSKPAEPEGPVCDAGVPAAPRKVWAVLYGDYGNRAQNLEGLYPSKEAAERSIGSPNDIEDYSVTEYEVHEDRGHEVADA